MVLVSRNIAVSLTVVVAASLLAGCGTLSRHFGSRSDEYLNSTEERPLEVPPDLSSPSSANALIVPQLASAPPSASAPASVAPPAVTETTAAAAAPATAPEVAAAPPAFDAGPRVALGGDGLVVSDSVDSTWTRVGLALERSGAATISARDAAAHTYTVATTGQTTTRPGWFKRAITFGQASNKVTAKVQLTVKVVAEGSASRVSVEGAGDEASRDAAHSLLQSLSERLT